MILKSKKFQVLLFDTVISLIVFLGGYYLAPEMMEVIVGVIGIIQVPVVAVITGHVVEESKKLETGTHASQQD